MVDPSLLPLLAEELERHQKTLEQEPAWDARRRALHALKGSAALVGLEGLSQQFAKLEGRVIAEDAGAVVRALELVAETLDAIARGAELDEPAFPVPPSELEAKPLTGPVAEYEAAMTDRLTRLDEALASGREPGDAVLLAYRELHAMKGAALAMGDDVAAWFCHGLEARLLAVQRDPSRSEGAIAELMNDRAMLGEVLTAPEAALEVLRKTQSPSKSGAGSRARAGTTATSGSIPPSIPSPPQPPTSAHPGPKTDAPGGSLVRVDAHALDRIYERVRQANRARGVVSARATEAGVDASRVSGLRDRLREALRLIGPPRPWGPPAAAIERMRSVLAELAHVERSLSASADSLREAADRVRQESIAAQRELSHLRTTHIAGLFDQVAEAVVPQARREGQQVRFTIRGGETPIDRRLAEQLLDPIMQLCRNAIAHGLESPARRAGQGKSAVGTIVLEAEITNGALRVQVEDDGAGVDFLDVRRRAAASGILSREMADRLDDETLLALLFVPGFTTRDSADLIAGRGVGLDLTLSAIRRLGGNIVLRSRAGAGLNATIVVPIEGGLTKIVWVKSTERWFAIPLSHVRHVEFGPDAIVHGATSLAALVGDRPPQTQAPVGIQLDALVGQRLLTGHITVEQFSSVDEVPVRGVSPLITAAGPYAGAIVRGDEVRFCLDAAAIVQRVTPT